jgi:hypothetical protein
MQITVTDTEKSLEKQLSNAGDFQRQVIALQSAASSSASSLLSPSVLLSPVFFIFLSPCIPPAQILRSPSVPHAHFSHAPLRLPL